MTFVGYTPWDMLGTLAGAGLMTKIDNALLHGYILAPIVAIFVFLTLVKIAMSSIIEHKYESALIDFVHLIVVILLFTLTANLTVINMNITNMGLAQQANQAGQTFLQGATHWLFNAHTSTTQNSTTIENVPIMAELFAFPDSVAYQLTSVMLNPSSPSVNTLDYDNLINDPQQLIYLGFAKMFYGTSNPMEVYSEARFCLEGDNSQKFINFVKGILHLGSIDCNAFYNTWATNMTNIYNQLQSQGNLPSNTAQLMQKEIYATQNGFGGDKSFVQPIINQLNTLTPEVDNIINSYSTTNNATQCGTGSSDAQTITCNAQAVINQVAPALRELIDSVGQIASNTFSLRGMLEKFMYQIQEYAIAIMFVLLPFVVILSLLPIFGRNYRLLATYMVSFFLIKLWIPVYWLIYTAMVNIAPLMLTEAHQVYNGIMYAVSTFTGNIAYASTSTSTVGGANLGQVAAALEAMKLAQKVGYYNEIILEAMCVLIPTVFGGGATFLVGKELMRAGALAAAEGAALTKSFLQFAMSKLGKLPNPFDWTPIIGKGGIEEGGKDIVPVGPSGVDRIYDASDVGGGGGKGIETLDSLYEPLNMNTPATGSERDYTNIDSYDYAFMRDGDRDYAFKNINGEWVNTGYIDLKTGKMVNTPQDVAFDREKVIRTFTQDAKYQGRVEDGSFKPFTKKEM